MSKIAIIGAGSMAYTRKLIADILLNRKLSGSIVALCDTDYDALDTITRLVHRLIIEFESDIKLESSIQRDDILSGADYVIQTIAVGGRAAWQEDLNIPLKYGIVQTSGDSVGPGGLSRALRTLPVVVEICNNMEEICPQAMLINYSNPNSCVCTAVHQYTNIDVIGLRYGLTEVQQKLANLLHVPLEETKVHPALIPLSQWMEPADQAT